MQRNDLDLKVMDYSWKKNRLSQQKASLKASVMQAIHKKKDEAAKKIDPNSVQINQANKVLSKRKDDDPAEKAKKDAQERADFKKQMMKK